MSDLDYNECEAIFDELNSDYSFSYAHGMLCGFLCVKDDASPELWLSEILSVDIKEIDKTKNSEDIYKIFNNTKQQLNDANLNFNILIADDLQSLSRQATTIVEWCEGFLIAIGLSNIASQEQELLDSIKDISEISKLNTDITDNNENATQLTEIVEFVRMNVLLIQDIAKPSKHKYIDTNIFG